MICRSSPSWNKNTRFLSPLGPTLRPAPWRQQKHVKCQHFWTSELRNQFTKGFFVAVYHMVMGQKCQSLLFKNSGDSWIFIPLHIPKCP